MAYSWAKVYIEILEDAKMGQLPDNLWRRVIEMILLAKRIDKDGILPGLAEMAWTLRISIEQLEADLQRLQSIHVVEIKDGNWFLINFAKRQAAEPVIERVRNFRKRRVSQSCNDDETQSYQTRLDKTKTRLDKDAEVGAKTAPSKPRKSTKRDERTDTPAIQACYKTVGKYPPLGLYDRLIGALGNAPDIQRLTECRTAWLERGYNSQAWTWATEWYASGVPSRNGHGQRGAGAEPPSEVAARRALERAKNGKS